MLYEYSKFNFNKSFYEIPGGLTKSVIKIIIFKWTLGAKLSPDTFEGVGKNFKSLFNSRKVWSLYCLPKAKIVAKI